MPEIDLMRVDQRDADARLDSSSPISKALDFDCFDVEVKVEEDSVCLKKISRRGRPPRTTIAKASSSSSSSSSPISAASLQQCRKKREDEDVCFVCFDGGSLVLCDRRGCPKVYHPSCVKRSEAFFRSRSKWICGWHICTVCQKDSYYMCYTCPYSVCKRCVRSSEYVVVKENKGFCGICMKTIMLIENVDDANNQEKVEVDFDDRGSWEYLFKIYWVSLKEKLSLSLDDLTNAKNPWKGSSMTSYKRRATTSGLHDKDVIKASRGKVRRIEDVSSSKLGSSLCERLPPLTSVAAWATDELLDFVGYMRNGDISVLSKYDVQTLVLEHVRRNNLQSSPHNSEIVCDPKLMRLFGKDRVDHFEMLKLLDSHFLDQERSPTTDTAAMSSQADASRSQAVVNTETCVDASTIWLYGDPDGKIHGPFSLLNLQQWNSSGHFPPELRIWRFDEEHNRSILLTDALNGQFDKTRQLQDRYIPTKQEETVISTKANDQDTSVAVVAKLESRVLDFSPNSVSTDQSVISSSNSSVVTKCSETSNKSGNSFSAPLDFTLSNEREALCSVSLWNKTKVDSPLLVQSPISCSLSLATFPGNTNSNRFLPQQERYGNAVKNDTNGLSGAAEKQATATTVQSCGQNWNAATPSSASNALDCNTGLVSFTDNHEIDFLDLFSPTFKFNFCSSASTMATTDWQSIVAGPDECDESVSDLLAEVEAMESQKCLPSPTSTYRSFSPMSSTTNDLQQMHSQTNNNTVDF